MNNQKKAINELLGNSEKWLVGFAAVLLIVMIPAWYGLLLSYIDHSENNHDLTAILVLFDMIKLGMLGFMTSIISTSFRTNMPAISLLPNKTGDTVSYLRRKLDMSVLMPLAYEILMLIFVLVKQSLGGFSGTVIDSPVKIAAYIFITAAAYGFYLCLTSLEPPSDSAKTTMVVKTLLMVFAFLLVAMAGFGAKTAAQLLILESAQPVIWLAASAIIAAAVWGYYLFVGRRKFIKNYFS